MNIFYVLGGVLTAGSSVGLLIVDSRWGIRETWNLYSNKRRQTEIIELHNIALGKGEGSISRTTSALRKHPLDMTINKFRLSTSPSVDAKGVDTEGIERTTPLLSGADKPVLSAEEIATFASDTTKSSVTPKRASVVRNGVNLTEFKGSSDKLASYMRKAGSKSMSDAVGSPRVGSSSEEVKTSDNLSDVSSSASGSPSSSPSVSGLNLRPNTSMLHSSGIISGGELLEETTYGGGFNSSPDGELAETTYGGGFSSSPDGDLEETTYGGGFNSSPDGELAETTYGGGFGSNPEGELEETKFMFNGGDAGTLGMTQHMVVDADGNLSSDLSDSRSLDEILGSVAMDIVDIGEGSDAQGSIGDTGGYSSKAPTRFNVSSIYSNIEL